MQSPNKTVCNSGMPNCRNPRNLINTKCLLKLLHLCLVSLSGAKPHPPLCCAAAHSQCIFFQLYLKPVVHTSFCRSHSLVALFLYDLAVSTVVTCFAMLFTLLFFFIAPPLALHQPSSIILCWLLCLASV